VGGSSPKYWFVLFGLPTQFFQFVKNIATRTILPTGDFPILNLSGKLMDAQLAFRSPNVHSTTTRLELISLLKARR